MLDPIKDKIFRIQDENDFNALSLEIFYHQVKNNVIYREYLQHLKIDCRSIHHWDEIPFLPIAFFKTHQLYIGSGTAEKVFSSSGTGGSGNSKHYIADVSIYEKSYEKGFELAYGPIKEWNIIALLPSYQEREDSSLIYMVNDFINQSHAPESGFYLGNTDNLIENLEHLEIQGRKTILLGVTYALLDLAEKHNLKLKNTIVMETGGMKGRRKEMVRPEVHEILCQAFGVEAIHSEYGMTELLSQAYSKGKGIFHPPPWMRVITRDMNDPFTKNQDGKTGGINIIDLANINSISFIETQDIGRIYPDHSFEIEGRFDSSELRGCNLMVH